MRAPCHLSMRTWERFSVLLLCSCLFVSSAVRCPPQGLGLGAALVQAEPLLLTGTEGLCFPGGPFRSKSRGWRRCQCTSPALELAPLPPDPQEGWLCRPVPAAHSGQPARLGCPLRCTEDCLPSVSKTIFIQSYFNIKISVSE